jgi:hypothetical protein
VRTSRLRRAGIWLGLVEEEPDGIPAEHLTGVGPPPSRPEQIEAVLAPCPSCAHRREVKIDLDDAYRLDSFLSALAHGRVVRTNAMTLDDLTECRSLAGVMRAATRRAEGKA